MSERPKVFIASSKEGRPWVSAVMKNLQGKAAQVTPWYNAFQIGQKTVDELLRNLRESEFGIFVLSPDDTSNIRDELQKSPRDNVILELGMFIGQLGTEKSFILKPQNVSVRLPTDLLGVVTGSYDDKRGDGDYASACACACDEIADAIAKRADVEFKVGSAVEATMEIICHALSVPIAPRKSSLRVFLFRKEGDELVCKFFRHSDPEQPKEGANKTRLTINTACAEKIVVVKCFLENTVQGKKFRVTGSAVRPLDTASSCVKGDIKRNLTYVLAAPILDKRGDVWGVLDFDASNAIGTKLLEQRASKKVMEDLAEYLSMVLT